jgi:hypothetical protein
MAKTVEVFVKRLPGYYGDPGDVGIFSTGKSQILTTTVTDNTGKVITSTKRTVEPTKLTSVCSAGFKSAIGFLPVKGTYTKLSVTYTAPKAEVKASKRTKKAR